MTIRDKRIAQWKEVQALRVRQVEVIHPGQALAQAMTLAMADYLEQPAALEALPPEPDIH